MDGLWNLWKSLCCGDEHRAYMSALFVKECLCCSRNIYKPLPTTAAPEFNPPFFVTGGLVTAKVYNHSHIDVDDGKFKHSIYDDETKITSYEMEETTQFRICCGCVVNDPEHNFYNMRERPRIRKDLDHAHDEAFNMALKQIVEFEKENPVAVFKVNAVFLELGDNKGKKEKGLTKALQCNRFSVPFLVCNVGNDKSYKPWTELADFEHLSLKTDKKVELTEKILNTGFLHFNAISTNPEEFEKFKGFGLFIGHFDDNGFSVDRLIQEVELWKADTPSTLEFFGICKASLATENPFSEVLQQLKTYSPTGELSPVSNGTPLKMQVMFLNDEKSAAILIINNYGVAFVRGGVERWLTVMECINETL